MDGRARTTRTGAVVAVVLGFAWACAAGCSGSSGADAPGDTSDAGPNVEGADASPANCGRLTTPCGTGGTCEGPPDCASGLCRDGKCGEVTPANGAKDGDETDVDCGGTKAPACADGKGCAIGDDCTSKVCKGGVCQAPSPNDGVKNGDETGVDCGGTSGKKCATGDGCLVDADCNQVKCDTTQKKCAAPSDSDGIKNGDETDIDCGGTATNKCITGKACLVNVDCAGNVLCEGNAGAKTCSAPRANDGLKNGNETDVDCGSSGAGANTNAPKCAVGQTCTMPVDCTSDGCGYDGKCVVAPSCAPHYGGDTCGKGEVGDPNAVHESCCASAPLPGNAAVKIDKYEITAGRVREFIRRTGGNVRAWVDANRNNIPSLKQQIPDAMLDYLPESETMPVRQIWQCDDKGQNCVANQSVSFGVYGHLGNNVFMQDRPCANCGQGCYVNTKPGQEAYGHNTYWWPKNIQEGTFSASERDYDQATLDTKSQNCVTQVLLAAFCAWDGGRLPTQAELGGTGGAWGPGSFPYSPENNVSYKTVWNAADPAKQPYKAYDNNGNATGVLDPNAFLVRMMDDNAQTVADAVSRNTVNWNPFGWSVPEARYVWPVRPFAKWGSPDQAFAIAAPGRMVNDRRKLGNGPLDGYFDVTANLLEVTGDYIGAIDDVQHNSWPRVKWVSGSFEGHDPTRGGYDLNVLTKYGKQGGRCARP